MSNSEDNSNMVLSQPERLGDISASPILNEIHKEKMDISHGHPCHDSNPPSSKVNHSSPNSPGNANYHLDDDSCKGDQHFAIGFSNDKAPSPPPQNSDQYMKLSQTLESHSEQPSSSDTSNDDLSSDQVDVPRWSSRILNNQKHANTSSSKNQEPTNLCLAFPKQTSTMVPPPPISYPKQSIQYNSVPSMDKQLGRIHQRTELKEGNR